MGVNASLLRFFKDVYPDLKDPQARAAWFLHEGMGRLFTEKSDYRRYWIMATREQYFAELDSNDDVNWSARKEMQPSDLLFIYRTSPRSAITDVFEVRDEPVSDPRAPWEGFWADLRRVCRIEDIAFADLRNDPILKGWGVVRKQFQEVIVEPVPHSVYNRLLQKIPERTRNLHSLQPEPTANIAPSGQFALEGDFEDEVIAPLLRRWSLDYHRQYRCRFRFGSQDYVGRVDFLVRDSRGPITLFENKLRILNDEDLNGAADQAKSYALMLGVPSFVVGSDITATFSEKMAFADGESSTSFTLEKVRVKGRNVITISTVPTSVENPASGQMNENKVRLTPNTALEKGTNYRVTITTSATDLVGNPLETARTWRFKTAPK